MIIVTLLVTVARAFTRVATGNTLHFNSIDLNRHAAEFWSVFGLNVWAQYFCQASVSSEPPITKKRTTKNYHNEKIVHQYPTAIVKHSSFCDERPDPFDVSLLVIHNISLPPGEFGGGDIANLFMGTLDAKKHAFFAEIAQLRVSAHCVIYRDGCIEQFVPFDKRAWHAGLSSFQGRAKCNDYSIGIELEGTDHEPYTDIQYTRLAELTCFIQQYYPRITQGRIVGHCDIAPGRKTDPGFAFNWQRFRQLNQELATRN